MRVSGLPLGGGLQLLGAAFSMALHSGAAAAAADAVSAGRSSDAVALLSTGVVPLEGGDCAEVVTSAECRLHAARTVTATIAARYLICMDGE